MTAHIRSLHRAHVPVCVCDLCEYGCLFERRGGFSSETCLGSSVVLLKPEQSNISLPSYRPQHNLFPQKFIGTDISLTKRVLVCVFLSCACSWCTDVATPDACWEAARWHHLHSEPFAPHLRLPLCAAWGLPANFRGPEQRDQHV